MEKWKEELTTLLENGCTDSDIEDFVQKHKGTDGREIWDFVGEYYAPERCKGCKHIQMLGMYPCNVCSRNRISEDHYESTQKKKYEFTGETKIIKLSSKKIILHRIRAFFTGRAHN